MLWSFISSENVKKKNLVTKVLPDTELISTLKFTRVFSTYTKHTTDGDNDDGKTAA